MPRSSSCSAAPFSHEVGVQANHLVATVVECSSGRQQNKKAQPIELADVSPYSGDIASHSVRWEALVPQHQKMLNNNQRVRD